MIVKSGFIGGNRCEAERSLAVFAMVNSWVHLSRERKVLLEG